MYARVALWTSRIMTALEELKSREEGQGLVEYALILVLVSIVSIAILAALGLKVSGVFQTITDTL
jgi:pilus assembly protein Flp/PilA